MGDQWDEAKRMLGDYAAQRVEPGMTLGIGSGSTVNAFIEALGARFRNSPFPLSCTAASRASGELAQQNGLPMIPIEQAGPLALAIDGADAVNGDGVLIKGGGAALVRERLVIQQAQRTLILIDESKLVHPFRHVVVPVAVIPFAWPATETRLQQISSGVRLRQSQGQPVVTDDGLYVFDAAVEDLTRPMDWHQAAKMIPGVVDTGVFSGFRHEVWVSNGQSVWPFHGSR